MIPLKLELRNFLSYGDAVQTIDFSNHHLICLSGKNGNGKSALLDGITWAVWGQARKLAGATKADEGLVRLGQTRMMASLTFVLNNKTYRVRREYAKTYGKPYAALDFEVFDAETEKFASLTDKTIRATQEKIEKTINLDYDTFTNSAFLRQGQSNEFSKKSAKERKQILSTILGLHRYDALQLESAQQAKKFIDEKNIALQVCKLFDDEIALQPTLQEQLTMAQEKITAQTGQLEQAKQLVTQTTTELQSLMEQQKLATFIKKNATTVEQQHEQQLTTLQNLRSAWRTMHYLLIKQPNRTELEARQRNLQRQQQEFLRSQQQAVELERQLMSLSKAHHEQELALHSELEKNITTAQRALDKELLRAQTLAQQQAKLSEQQQALTLQQLALRTAEEELTTQLAHEPAMTKQLQTMTAQLEKRKAFYQGLIAQGNHLKQQQKELANRQQLAVDSQSPTCPLCEQTVATDRKQLIAQHLHEQERFINSRLARIALLLGRLKEMLIAQNNEKIALEKQVQQLALAAGTLQKTTIQRSLLATQESTLAVSINQLTQQQAELATSTLIPLQETIASLSRQLAQLAQHELLVTSSQRITAMTSQHAALTATLADGQRIEQELAAIQQALTATNDLAAAQHEQQARRIQISQLIHQLRQHRLVLQDYNAQLAKLSCDEGKQQALTAAVITTQSDCEALGQALQQTKVLALGLEQSLTRIATLAVQRSEKQKAIAALDAEIEDYTTLSQAFGKNGIQALLIEEAIPEIETEANELLATLTDNQSQLFIESLRDLKSGGVRETLEIKISDALGIRPYEMFSGGEAFRVDFALRIAISKLLARRAGTALQTLIIDEGFGSQDEEGLARVMNALHAIGNNFAKIIIVSHLPEFKDNFPVHFVIEKTSAGSQVHVELRG